MIGALYAWAQIVAHMIHPAVIAAALVLLFLVALAWLALDFLRWVESYGEEQDQ